MEIELKAKAEDKKSEKGRENMIKEWEGGGNRTKIREGTPKIVSNKRKEKEKPKSKTNIISKDRENYIYKRPCKRKKWGEYEDRGHQSWNLERATSLRMGGVFNGRDRGSFCLRRSWLGDVSPVSTHLQDPVAQLHRMRSGGISSLSYPRATAFLGFLLCSLDALTIFFSFMEI